MSLAAPASNAFLTFSWIALGIGVLFDAYNAFLLAHKLVTRRFTSAVWVVPLVFYGMAASLRAASSAPASWELLAGLAALHLGLLAAHTLTGRHG